MPTMSFLTNIDVTIYKQTALYNASTSIEQIILRVLAVLNHRLPQVKFKQILQELSHADAFNRLKLDTLFTIEMKEHFEIQGLISVTQEGIKLSPYLADYLIRITLEEETFEGIVDVIERVHPMMSAYSWGRPNFSNTQRIIRDSFYRGQYQICVELLAFNKDPQKVESELNQTLISLCFYPFNEVYFLKLPYQMQYQAFASLLHHLRKTMKDRREVTELLSRMFSQIPSDDCNLRCLFAEQYLLHGQLKKAQALLLPQEKTAYGLQLQASLNFVTGDINTVVDLFTQALSVKNKISRRKAQYIGDLYGIFYAMTLLRQGSDELPEQLSVLFNELGNQHDDRRFESVYQQVYGCLNRFAMVLAGRSKYLELSDPYTHINNYAYHVYVVTSCLCFAWANQKPSAAFLRQLNDSCQQLHDIGEFLWSKISVDLLTKYNQTIPVEAIFQSSLINFPNLIARKETWALALEQLMALDPSKQANGEGEKEEKTSRLVWLLQHSRFGDELTAKEQKLGKSGWTKGRSISLKRLSQETATFDYLSQGDIALCHQIKAYFGVGYYGKEQYALTGYPALKAAIGLENLYLEDNHHDNITISEREPELLITQTDNSFLLSINNLPSDLDDNEESYSLTDIGNNQFELVAYENKHRQIASIVGESGLVVPQDAKEQVIKSINAIAPMLNIQSNLEGITNSVEQVKADGRLYINIEPAGAGLEYQCHVLPLGIDGPTLLAGVGNSTLSQDISGKRQSVTRDLVFERRQLNRLYEQVPLFEQMIDGRLLCDRLDEALETLQMLEHIVANPNKKLPLDIVLQWPKGKSLKLSAPQELAHLKLAVTKQKEWFNLEGTLTVSDEQVIELKTLMALMAQGQSRFVQLDGGQILVLTKELKQRLLDLDNMTIDGQFHVLASPLVDAATQGMRMRTLHAWERQKVLLDEAGELMPVIPSTLQAQLRDYQIEGFEWAMRLAHWGAGACLADDMGLGKTLQALAVIVARAPKGPSLVLAPTSVCFNWQQEIARFAPTLNVKVFGRDGDINDRQQMLENLAPFDVVISSYGLLQREGEKLASVQWQTVVADEAQAIKNPLTKRTQAALMLNAQFKMITTGTPIENNLTELWSLFRFINPGLLGSQKQFHKRFAQLIESNKDSDDAAKRRASFALKQVISPFILRRLKSQVLTELPARTEINLPIELSEQEITFYEALRRQAIENLMNEDVEAGQQHIKMLAEIMKLRRACCHPSLVMPTSNIESSKLKAFDKLMVDLKQNNHKTLVFSQFVGHLQLLKERLITNGISFQYLDGSTPSSQRQQSVNAFQAGEGDVFLISLKAGGSGLNLTAADYVVHMDPWWNPAVEDQASDRAHRMGQTRPVTIYRFIAKNTIEDKIVALHQHKRNLANNLLEGSDTSNNLSPEDMMALLQESW